MGEVIAETYEVVQQIGKGGGGRVYLAKHKRLDKWVVLKADKRKVTASPALLRREVDVLKDLHHPNIPQVYDFFAEGETVYTAIDYISGESLDKPLERGERFSQAQIVKWARQVLDALCYLHSPTHGDPPRGYVHSDIKPANLMCKPDGDICLIDFNIALAIGEENVMGSSPGYASPEHYGQDYTFEGASVVVQADETVLMESDTVTQTMEMAETSRKRKKVIIPDARSDIYSLGATLYHMLSGNRPAKYAVDVTPLSEKEYGPQLARIINKAMAPNPDERYQTAEEMLDAFRHLWENDPRTRRFKRTRNIVAGSLAAVFLAGAAMTFAGLRQMERAQAVAAQEARQAEEQERQFKEALTAVRASENAYQQGDIPAATQKALEALSAQTPYSTQAQKALTDALGVYDLTDGLKPHLTIELPSEALKLTISDSGEYVAALYAYSVLAANTQTGETVAELLTRPTAVSDLCFFRQDRLLYAGEQGITVYDLTARQTLWTGQPVTRLTISGDETRAAGVDNQADHALIYDLADGTLLREVAFRGRRQGLPAGGGVLADPEDTLLALNRDGTWLAASFEGGGLCLYDVAGGEEYPIFDTSSYTHFEGGFYDHYFAFSAWNNAECVFLIYDMATMTQAGGFSATARYLTRTDEQGIYVARGNLLVRIDPVTGAQRELAYTGSDIVSFTRTETGRVLVALKDGGYALFNEYAQQIDAGTREKGCELLGMAGDHVALASLETPTVQILRLRTYPEAQICAYDPQNAHIEARLSADGETIMLFQFDGFFLYSGTGMLLTHVEIPDAQQVYDQQYRREGGSSWLEVTYEDGLIRAYSAADGAALWERQGATPDESLRETFETAKWRIEAPLHEAPVVYDKETGESLRELEKDSYLTYVTEVGEYIVTQYLSARGEWYGMLLDQACETLAYLPNLCDVAGDTLLFDDGMGNLRQSRIYSLRELKALATK